MEVTLGQSIVQSALVAEALDERVDECRSERRRQLEALDRDELTQPNVRSAIDDAETALANVPVDAKLSV
jgi:hypothetical protein